LKFGAFDESMRKAVPGIALIAVLLLLHMPAMAGAAALLPQPPCGSEPYPALPATDAAPNTGLWTGAEVGRTWTPPACTGWQAGATTFLIAVSGHFSSASRAAGMLAHIGMISALPAIRYWSVTDKKWNPLFTRATALGGPDAKSTRPDFAPAEFRAGGDLYFLSVDNRVASDLVTRLHTTIAGPERIVLDTTNLSSLRWLGITIVPAGGMQTIYFLDRQRDQSWAFYSLTRIRNASLLLSALVSGPSYLNRAVAMYRYFAGIPTDRDPPVSP
jgi:hypothetical protein